MVDTKLNIVIEAENKANVGLEKTKKSIININKESKKALKSFAKLGSAIVVGFGVAAVKAASDFEAGMANVATLLDKEALPRLNEMKESLFDIAKTSGTSLKELTDGLFFTVSAGVEAEKQVDFLNAANKLAIAGNTTLETAISAVVGTMKAYGKESLGASKLSDLLFSINKKGFTTFEQIAGAMPKVASQANLLGVSQEELAAAMATLVGATGNADEVSTQLKGTFTALAKPSEAMKETLRAIGFESGFAAVESLGLQGTLQALRTQVGGTDEAFSGLFNNVRAITGVIPLAGTLSETFTQNLSEMANAVGVTEEAFQKMNETFDRQVKKLKQELSVALIEVGNIAMKALLDATKELDSFFKQFMTTNTNLSDIIGKTLMFVIENITRAIIFWATVLETVTEAIEIVVLAIGDLFNGTSNLAAAWEQGLFPILRKATDLWDGIVSVLGDAIDSILKFLGLQGEVNKGGGASALGGGITGRFADGGFVSGRGPILVGEKGPEIFNPGGAGTVIPNNKLGGGSNVTINIQGNFVGNQEEAERIGDIILGRLQNSSAVITS